MISSAVRTAVLKSMLVNKNKLSAETLVHKRSLYLKWKVKFEVTEIPTRTQAKWCKGKCTLGPYESVCWRDTPQESRERAAEIVLDMIKRDLPVDDEPKKSADRDSTGGRVEEPKNDDGLCGSNGSVDIQTDCADPAPGDRGHGRRACRDDGRAIHAAVPPDDVTSADFVGSPLYHSDRAPAVNGHVCACCAPVGYVWQLYRYPRCAADPCPLYAAANHCAYCDPPDTCCFGDDSFVVECHPYATYSQPAHDGHHHHHHHHYYYYYYYYYYDVVVRSVGANNGGGAI